LRHLAFGAVIPAFPRYGLLLTGPIIASSQQHSQWHDSPFHCSISPRLSDELEKQARHQQRLCPNRTLRKFLILFSAKHLTQLQFAKIHGVQSCDDFSSEFRPKAVTTILTFRNWAALSAQLAPTARDYEMVARTY
jgi:hypothetical protein